MTPDTRIFIKWLYPDGRPAHGGKGTWPLPTQNADGSWTPGAPISVAGALIPCRNGLHLCRLKDAPEWINDSLPYLVQYQGEMVELRDKVVVRTARLVRRLHWDDTARRLFAADCAEYALNALTVKPDPRSFEAIKVARAFARGEATAIQLGAARSAAESAAWDAAWDAAGSAAWSAAWSAAGSAAWSAAESAAWSAAESAAESAAWSAAWSAAREWQGQRLWHYFRQG